MHVEIAGKHIRLEQRQVLGVGGEGTVFLAKIGGEQVAVKIYHTPTPQRQEKLRAFLDRRWNLPPQRVALPQQAVYDPARGEIIGLCMPYLGSGFEELARLASKKQRAAGLISARDVARLFLDGAAMLARIHRAGLVVGDFNDQNALYRICSSPGPRELQMLWIDVDAWQFAGYPCSVATEDFVAPELYGIDLSLKPVFEPQHDWYAFAVHLFRSLLLAHPYGGAHRDYQALTQRAQRHIFVLQPDVTYPRIAYPPELLSDDLAQVFTRIFAGGWRGIFPRAALEAYHDSLTACSSCALEYPRERRACPFCQAKTLVEVRQPRTLAAGLQVSELLRTRGRIIFARVQGERLYALAYEQGSAVLYTKEPGLAARRRELFAEIAGARYALCGTTLLVNPPRSTQIRLYDIAGERPRALETLETAIFAGTRHAQFAADARQIYTLANGALICHTREHGALPARPLRTVIESQTWFRAAPTTPDGLPTLFGYFQVLRRQLYWLMRGRAVYEVALPELQPEEALLDIAVYFSGQGLLVRRLTHERGSDYLRTEIVDNRGQVVHSSARTRRAEHPGRGIHGLACAGSILLHALDSGIVQERVAEGSFKTFPDTAGHVQEGDALEVYQSGLLVIHEDRISYLVIQK